MHVCFEKKIHGPYAVQIQNVLLVCCSIDLSIVPTVNSVARVNVNRFARCHHPVAHISTMSQCNLVTLTFLPKSWNFYYLPFWKNGPEEVNRR